MLSAKITNTQLLRTPMPFHGKGSSFSFAFVNEQCISIPCPWKSLDKLKRENFNVRRVEFQKGRLILIKAVATFEPKSLAAKGGKCMDSKELEPPEFSDEESEQVDEKEKLRRKRISKANKGNTPWNKGRKHSAGNQILILACFTFHSLLLLSIF